MSEMSVRYNKLWKLLIDKKMSKADLRKAIVVSPSTMTKLRRDENVSLEVLLKICALFDCKMDDILDVVKSDVPGEVK